MWYPDIRLTRTFRLAFMITLIASFFVISPLIIFYTAGYRFDFEEMRIRKTGVITIDAEPTNARVFLNNVKLTKSIPIRLTNRAPGQYSVRIEQDGFLPWQKSVQVESTQTTYATDIYLYKDTLSTFEYSSTSSIATSYSPDGAYVATVRQPHQSPVYEVLLYSIATGKETLLWRNASQTMPSLMWSNHAPRLAIVSHTELRTTIETIDARTPDNIHTYVLTTSEPVVQWHEDGDDVLYAMDDDTQIVSLTNGNTKILSSVSSSLWFVDNNEDVWTITKTQQLWKNDTLLVPNIDTASITRIVDSRASHLLARNENEVFIIWLDSGEVTTVVASGLFPKTYGKNWSTWILWSEWEVHELFERGEMTLLTRTNEPLKGVHASTKHETLLFTFDTQIRSFHPHYRTTHTLFEGDAQITQTVAQEDGDYILFETAINNRQGIYKRDL